MIFYIAFTLLFSIVIIFSILEIYDYFMNLQESTPYLKYLDRYIRYLHGFLLVLLFFYVYFDPIVGDYFIFLFIVIMIQFFLIMFFTKKKLLRETIIWSIFISSTILYHKFYHNISYLHVHFRFFIWLFGYNVIQILFYLLYRRKSIISNKMNTPIVSIFRKKWLSFVLCLVLRILAFFLVAMIGFIIWFASSFTEFAKFEERGRGMSNALVKFYHLSAKEPEKRHFPCINQGWLCLQNYDPCDKGFYYYQSDLSDWSNSCWQKKIKTKKDLSHSKPGYKFRFKKCFRSIGTGKNAKVEIKFLEKYSCRDRFFREFLRTTCFVDRQGRMLGFCERGRLKAVDYLEIERQHSIWKRKKQFFPP